MTVTATTIVLPRPHRAQAQVLAEAHAANSRFNVLCCGRRWGKTTLGVDRLVGPATIGKAPVAWFSPSYKMLSDTWRAVRRTLQDVTTHKDEQEHRLELLGGGSVEMWSLSDPDVARGRKYARAVIDEAARVPELQEAWEAVIRPTLSDYRGDTWFLSTPHGYNYFHELYMRGVDRDQPDWLSWQMPTSTNPYIALDEILAAKRDLPPALFAQEYEASFRALAEARFDVDAVNQALTACRPPLDLPVPEGLASPYLRLWSLPRPGIPYVAYTDSAEGKGRDYTVTVVAEARTLRHVATLRDNVLEPGQHASLAVQLCRWFNTAFWGVERNRGEAVLYVVGQSGYERVYWHDDGLALTQAQTWNPREGRGRLGMPVTEHTRIGMIDDLAQVILDRSLGSDDEVWWREAAAFAYNDAGRPEAASGAHDDCVMAMAGLVRMARQPGAQEMLPSAQQGKAPRFYEYGSGSGVEYERETEKRVIVRRGY